VKPGGQREKGKTFERKIAAMIRARWPGALVRRASQAERAHNPDVFIEGGPRILQRLWLELQDSAHPTPIAKLDQAVRDVASDPRQYARGEHRLPVAITHRLRSQEITATIALHDLCHILHPDAIAVSSRFRVTLGLDALLELVSHHAAAGWEYVESEAA
jgi:hypothetical protein